MLHGIRSSYASGCRCLLCRAANADYVRLHRQPSGTVPADDVRAHLDQLAALGMGHRQLAKSAGVAASTIAGVRDGSKPTLTPTTAAKILAAALALAPGALVAGTRSHRYLDSMEREGFTRRELAWHLGRKSQQLQFAKTRIRALSAARIARLYDRLAET